MSTTTPYFGPTTIENAPAGNHDALRAVEQKMGFLPNMFATLGNSEAVLGGYLALDQAFSKSGFSPVEQQAIFLATSRANGCHYCVPAHSTVLVNMMKVDQDTVNAIRADKSTGNEKHDALIALTTNVVETRGSAKPELVEKFFAVGYTPKHLQELVVGIAMKTITNYTAALADIPLDPQFQPQA